MSSRQRALKLRVLLCSPDNPDCRDGLGYHVPSFQTSRAIKSLPSNSTNLDALDSRSRLTFFRSRHTPILQIEEDPPVGETDPLPFHRKPELISHLVSRSAYIIPSSTHPPMSYRADSFCDGTNATNQIVRQRTSISAGFTVTTA